MRTSNTNGTQNRPVEKRKVNTAYKINSEEPVKDEELGVWRNCFYKRGDESYVFYSNASRFLLTY